jgi:hypothetical protein
VDAISGIVPVSTSKQDVFIHFPFRTAETPARDRYFSLRIRKHRKVIERSCERRAVVLEFQAQYTIHERYQQRMGADAELIQDAIDGVHDGAEILKIEELDTDMDDVDGVAYHQRVFEVTYAYS